MRRGGFAGWCVWMATGGLMHWGFVGCDVRPGKDDSSSSC